MPSLTIRGVDVEFPFTPYPCQEDYMDRVIQCLQGGNNGILESPTGTGKTLCLLCATLAWRQAYVARLELERCKSQAGGETSQQSLFRTKLNGQLSAATGTWGHDGSNNLGYFAEVPKIIYSSRTHSQLTQAIQELRRTAYSSAKVAVIGSREQLCIHPEVSKQESNNNKVYMCRAKVSARTCHFYNNVEIMKSKAQFNQGILDVEDLMQLGNKHKVCPYYISRERKSSADIVFMPYNYLLDPKSRRTHGIELSGNIVIFDEAHNVERICEEAVSFDLTPYDLASCISETGHILETATKVEELNKQFNHFESSGMDLDKEELSELKKLFMNLEKIMDDYQKDMPRDGNGITKPGNYIYDVLKQVKIDNNSYSAVLDFLEKVIQHIANSGKSFTKSVGLQKFSDILKIVFADDASDVKKQSEYCKVHIHRQEVKKKTKNDGWANFRDQAEKSGNTLSYWCFSPGFTMKDIVFQGVRSIILTSGTLSPLNSFRSELQIEFPVQLENPHVIDKHQVKVGVVTKGPSGVVLNSSYENRSNPSYIASLGNTIVNFVRVVPNGVLVFFPSYPVMNNCIEVWQREGVARRIAQYKPMFVEPKGKLQFSQIMEEFYQKINDPTLNGAVFFAVCRGKVSEGMDFADINGRAVVITGLPFPPRMDPKVRLKMKFLDDAKTKGLSGSHWYRQQASRAVNQAVGRVIRHKQDYGAILLCDQRFGYVDARSQLPAWVRPHVSVYQNFGQVIKDLQNFFRTAHKMMPAPLKKPAAVKAADLSDDDDPGLDPAASCTADKDSSSVKAHFVDTHRVTSLRRQSSSQRDGPTNVKCSDLKDMYGGRADACCNPTRPKTSQKSTLFEALDHSQQREEDSILSFESSELNINNSQEKRTFIAKATYPKKQVVKKKKIVIVKPMVVDGSDSARDTSDDGQSDPKVQESSAIQVKKKKILLSAQDYVSQARKVLNSTQYKSFSRLLHDYKKDNNFQTVVSGLADLFIEDQTHHPLFRNFYQFVPPHQKKEFDELCQSLTGQGCGYQTEHSLPRKKQKIDHHFTQSTQGEGSCTDEKRPADIQVEEEGDNFAKKISCDGSEVKDPLDKNLNHGRCHLTSVTSRLTAEKNNQYQYSETEQKSASGKITSFFSAMSSGSRSKHQSKVSGPEGAVGGSAGSDFQHMAAKSPVSLSPNHSDSQNNSLSLFDDSSEWSSKSSEELPLAITGQGSKDVNRGVGQTGVTVGTESCSDKGDENSSSSGSVVILDDPKELVTETNSYGEFGVPRCPLQAPRQNETDWKCELCQLGSVNPHRSPCDHICCYSCWHTQLKKYKKCPVCGKFMKRRQLERLYFSDSKNTY